jgi:tRNA/rRNA methyltransferase
MEFCRIVLVGTQIAANLGSVARAMRNFGASDLVLVSPVADRLDQNARQTATRHADDLLEKCRVVGRLEEALAGCVLAAATSARTGGLFRRQTIGPPDEIAARLIASAPKGPVALVFGPEASGLSNDDVQLCPYLIHIPTEPESGALNLAQAAAICLYEIRRAWLGRDSAESDDNEVVPWERQAHLFAQLQSGLERIGYLRGIRGDALMHALRHLVGRARPTPMEARLLYGLARQLHWIAGQAKLDRRALVCDTALEGTETTRDTREEQPE